MPKSSLLLLLLNRISGVCYTNSLSCYFFYYWSKSCPTTIIASLCASSTFVNCSCFFINFFKEKNYFNSLYCRIIKRARSAMTHVMCQNTNCSRNPLSLSKSINFVQIKTKHKTCIALFDNSIATTFENVGAMNKIIAKASR